MLNAADLQREAAKTGFRPDALEKVARLFELLEGLCRHPFLKTRVVLKGGTALNLFIFDVPRLSVDIDLNYIGTAELETMLSERPKVEQAVQAVCGRLGIRIRRTPADHAGGKWRLSYESIGGGGGSLELDVNFMLRTPLWPPAPASSRPLGSFGVTQVPMLDVHELAAGKLAALFGRAACRDLFDVRELLGADALDAKKLRIGFIVYGGINRRDWRTVSLDDVQSDAVDVNRELVPLLRAQVAPPRDRISDWTMRLVDECRNLLSVILPLKEKEIEFLNRLNERGEIVPELLTSDDSLRATIRSHPGLLWKAINVRKYKGLNGGE
jgi:hypothetical protein